MPAPPTELDEFAKAARDLAKLGFRVFPLQPNSKLPIPKVSWPTLATKNVEKIERVWPTRYPKHNVGITTGNGLIVLDADCSKDRPGLESLELLDMMGLPPSLRVRTPSGGIHVYLTVPLDAGIGLSVDTLEGYPGIDIRGEGGYVVGPGSVIDGRPYEWL